MFIFSLFLMKQRYFLLIGFIIMFLWFFQNVLAASIPTTDLRLELLLTTWALDTSGINRIVTATGWAPQYKVDATTGVPFAQFGGSWGLTAITWWNWTNLDDFTISFWVKVRPQDFPGSGSTYFFNPYVAPYGYVSSSTGYYLPTILSSHTSPTVNAFSIRLRKDYQCALWGVKNWTWTWALYYHDSINNPGLWINCSKLNDSKWHIMVAKRYNRTLTLQIDSDTIYTGSGGNNDMYVGRIFSLGYFPLRADSWALIYQMWENPNITNSTSYFSWGLTKFRFYSRALTALEISALQDENIISQSELTGTWNISVALDSYNSPNLQLTLSWIPLSLSKNKVTYQFSTNSWTYVDVLSWSIIDTSTSTWSYKYRLVLNMSIYPDGITNVALRTKSGATFTTLGTVKFTKLDLPYWIIITEPPTSLSISKTQTAALIWTWGVLTMSITRWNICDATLIFDNYADMVFTSKSDNFTRICYKGHYAWIGKTIYQLSNPIQGITWPSNSLNWSRIFDDYLNWTKSAYAKINDTASTVLDLLAVSASASNGTVNGVTMVDINGDWLVDFLYSRNDPIRKSIIANNGNFTFRTVYKCATDTWATTMYYGDCADSTR